MDKNGWTESTSFLPFKKKNMASFYLIFTPLCHRISPAECQPSCAARTEADGKGVGVLWRCWWKGPRRPADHWNSMYRPGVWRHKKSDVWEWPKRELPYIEKPWFFRGPWHGGVLGGQNVWWPLTCCKLGFLVSYALQVGFSLFVWVAVFSSFVAWWPASTCLAAPCADGILTEPCMEGRGKLFHLPLRCVQSRLWGLKFDVCSICLVPAVSGRHLGGCYMLHSCLTPPAPCLWNTPPKAGGCRWKHMKTPPKTIT